MAIRIDVKEYCSDCFDFEPDVTRPEKTSAYTVGSVEPIVSYQTDTVVRCKYGKRCEGIKRYLERKG